jgi:putative heme-binding domain-containing protein
MSLEPLLTAGGDIGRGRRIFFGEKVACSSCHTIGTEGGHVGPDLSNLVFRDYASVLKDIREPSAALNPDHLASTVELTDGESVTGILTESGGDRIIVVDASASVRAFPKSQVKTIKPSAVSLMPEGLDKAIPPDQFRDLLTYLLTEPLEPAPIIAKVPPPPPRKRAEVEAVLKQSALRVPRSALATPFRIVLCAGPKDHGPGEHDYPLWQQRWSQLLALAAGIAVETAQVWPGDAQWKSADVVAFYSSNPGWSPERGRELDAFLERGGGLAYFHWAVEGRTNAASLAERIGLASNSTQIKYRHGPVDLIFHAHPLAEGLSGPLSILDETYWKLTGDPARVELLASGVEDGESWPQMWTRTQSKGRVFVSLPGHDTWTFDDPLYRLLALRGLCWAGGQPMDRLAELATIGVRMQ